MRSEKLDPVERDICGEYKGWNAHVRNGERQCDRCRRAAADYARDRRHRIGESTSKLYTAAEIEEIQRMAVMEACMNSDIATLTRRASRAKYGTRPMRQHLKFKKGRK